MNICKNCNAPYVSDAVFCSQCGAKIEKPKSAEPLKIPQTMTVSEAAKVFFQGRVSQGLIYQAVREHRMPHVKLSSGKVLLDVDELTKWWGEELNKSRMTAVKGLRRVD